MLTANAPSELGPELANNDQPMRASFARVDVVWRIALCFFIVQLVAMLVFTTAQYQRFNLTNDFAAYAQSWTAIAHGHLSPFSTVFGVPFWRNDLELLMWPLALFYWVYPHAVTLLWLQVLAVLGGELVVLMWARDIVKGRLRNDPLAPLVLALITALLLLAPWSWYTIGFDFHLEPFTTLFALLAARDMWRDRYLRSLCIWVPLTLLSAAAPGSLLVIGLGLVGVLSRNASRRKGLVVIALGTGWLALAAGLGAMRFGNLRMSSMYGYLWGHSQGQLGLSRILEGVIANPIAAWHMFDSHIVYIVGYVVAAGIVGLYSRWGLIIAALVFFPTTLNADSNFIHFEQSFQSWPAVLFLIAAYILALERLAGNRPLPRALFYVAGTVTIALAAMVTYLYVGNIPAYIDRVSPGAATELAAVQGEIPLNVEVIASQGIIGRFGPGHVAFSYWADGQPETYPLDRTRVIFILAPTQGTAEGMAGETRQAIRYVRSGIDAKALAQGSGIWAYSWMPKPGTRSVVLP